MRAELQPRKGKYYNTEITLTDDNGVESVLKVYLRGGGEPSDRELSPYTRQDWEDNIMIPDGWGDEMPIRTDFIDWSHYENERTLALAEFIVNAINASNP